MADSLEIRAALFTDCDAIAALLTELHQTEGYNVIADAGKVARALFVTVQEVQLSALVAVRNDVIVGVLLYYPGYDTLSATYGNHLADIIVTKEARTQGVGKALVSALAKSTLAVNKEWVSLTALASNASAQVFYKSLGMSQVPVQFFAAGRQALSQL